MSNSFNISNFVEEMKDLSFFYHFSKLNPKIRFISFVVLVLFFGYISLEIYSTILEKGTQHIIFLIASIIATVCWIIKTIAEYPNIFKKTDMETSP